MCYWILTQSGKVIARTTVQHVTLPELQKDETKKRVEEYDKSIEERLSDANFTIDEQPDTFYLDDEDENEFNREDDENTPSNEEYGEMLQEPKLDVEDEMYDQYLNAEVLIDRGGKKVHARVTKRAQLADGTPVRQGHSNPLLDTREYECVTDDGEVERYMVNVIVENLFAQCDTEGHQFMVLDEIVNHKKDNSVIPISEGFTVSCNGNQISKKTTRGWKLMVTWKDGSSNWVDLKDLKDSNPVELAEYTVANRIQEEPAFKWWVSNTLWHRNQIISKLKKCYYQMTHKFGIKVPHSVAEALEIDKETGTDFWWKAIAKEHKKIMVAFDLNLDTSVEDVHNGLWHGEFVGYQEINCHWIFDVKMTLERKARFVAGGHMTEPPASATYSSVVS